MGSAPGAGSRWRRALVLVFLCTGLLAQPAFAEVCTPADNLASPRARCRSGGAASRRFRWAQAPCRAPGVSTAHTHHMRTTQEYSCEGIQRVPPEQRCEFVRANCEDGALLPPHAPAAPQPRAPRRGSSGSDPGGRAGAACSEPCPRRHTAAGAAPGPAAAWRRAAAAGPCSFGVLSMQCRPRTRQPHASPHPLLHWAGPQIRSSPTPGSTTAMWRSAACCCAVLSWWAAAWAASHAAVPRARMRTERLTPPIRAAPERMHPTCARPRPKPLLCPLSHPPPPASPPHPSHPATTPDAGRSPGAALFLPPWRRSRVLLQPHHGARQPEHPQDAAALRGRCARAPLGGARGGGGGGRAFRFKGRAGWGGQGRGQRAARRQRAPGPGARAVAPVCESRPASGAAPLSPTRRSRARNPVGWSARPQRQHRRGHACDASHRTPHPPPIKPPLARPAVTFVALGNGAPDLSANISAIKSGGIQLSAGGITGAAMFVQCIVAAEVRGRAGRGAGGGGECWPAGCGRGRV